MSMHPDLSLLVDSADWFFTASIPAPSYFDDSAHRFEVEWKNARRLLSDRWSDDELGAIDELVDGLSHDAGPALVIVHGQGGVTVAESLDEPVRRMTVHEGRLPRLSTIIEARQRAIPHVVVETDRAGADLTAFYGSDVLSVDQVQGDTVYIHRGAAGGWSQKRFQQRAENTWERNGNEVAEAVIDLARSVDARLIAVAGDVRAQGFVVAALPSDLAGITVKIDEGSPDGIADHVVRLVASQVASHITELAEQLGAGIGKSTATVDLDETLKALATGRVDTLLVHDDDNDEPVTVQSVAGLPSRIRVIDAAIVAALRSDAQICIVPNLSVLNGPVAALLRW